MKTNLAPSHLSSVAPRRRRFMLAALLSVLVAGAPLVPLTAQTVTSAVPAFLSFQGRVTTPAGAIVGAGTPVNRTVTFRIWNHPSDSLAANLLYSEQQVATISEGEFSVLIGQGAATTGAPLGYSETTKGKPTVTIADAGVFNSATRYLGVTVDDGNAGTVDPEISPRQQIVTAAFAFRAKYAEQIGTNGNTTISTLDNGRVGIGNASPAATLDVNGGIKATGAGGYTFGTGDTDGGIFSPADNTLTFFTNNAERVRLVGDNLGIGTNNPLTRLDVNGNIAASAAGGYVFGGGDTDTGMFSPGDNNILFKTGGTERVRFLSNGHVGIGVNNPGFQLDVRSTVAHGAEMAIGDLFGGKGALYFGNTAHGLKRNFVSAANDIGLFTTDGKIHLSAAGATVGQFVLTSAGDVGIGTSSPLARLHVSAANSSGTTGFHVLPGTLYGVNTLNAVTLDVPGTASGTMAVWDNFGASGTIRSSGFTFNGPGDADGGIFSPSDGIMTFWTNGAEKMRLDASGNLGLGTTTMTAKLDVNGNIAAKGGFVFGYNDVDTGMFPLAGGDNNTIIFQTANLERVRFTSDGRVGIGTGSPIAPLHVAGTAARVSFFFGYWTDADGGHDANGTRTDLDHQIVASGRMRATHYDVESDARIKLPTGRSAGAADLAKLQQIEITDYTFKDRVDRGARPQKKVIAQQVEKVFPDAVGVTTGVVPDIYQKAAVKGGWVELATDLKTGERVRLVGEKEEGVFEVLEVKADRFRTAFTPKDEKAFVYGREVKDFRVVDYEAISMLNVSATQEIKREKDAEVKALRAENAALRAELAALASKEKARDAKLAAIEKLLSSPSTVMARPAALPTANGQD